MFEGWVANLLNRVLGSYVEEGCFRPDKVSTSVYGGHMVLSELEIRKDAFDTVEAPIKLRRGFIGQVDIKIPWTHLGSQPVEISIDRVFLILEPSIEYNARDYQRKLKARKKADLARAELRKSSGLSSINRDKDDADTIARANMSEAEEMAKSGFTARLMNKIVDNIELNVRNVHVRYEDRVTNPKHAFSVGVTWESLKMQSTDRHWNPCFVDLVAEIKRRLEESGKYLEKLLAYKLFKLEHFAVYWDPFPGTSSDGPGLDYSTCTFAEMAAVFERMIPKRQQQEEEDFRLVDREQRRARLRLDRTYMTPSPNENTDREGSEESDLERIRNAAAIAAAMASASHHKTRARLGTGAQHCFILEPVGLTLKMQSNRDPRFPDSPDTVLDLDLDPVTMVLERFQFLDAWEMLAAFDAAEKSYPYAELRPKGVTVRDAPRIWWQFAIRATLEDVRERRRRFSAEYITHRREDRLRYIELWKRSLAGRPRSEVAASVSTPKRTRTQQIAANGNVTSTMVDSPILLQRDMMRRGRRIADLQSTPMKSKKRDEQYSTTDHESTGLGIDTDAAPSIVITDYLELSPHEQKELEQLEDRYDVEDIMYFRSLAENQLRLERAHLHLLEFERRASGKPVAQEDTPGWAGAVFGWAGWAVGLGGSSAASHTQQRPATSAAANAAAHGEERPLMTREEQERLFEMLNFDPTEILEANAAAGQRPPMASSAEVSRGGANGVGSRSIQSRGVRIKSVLRFRMEECRLQLWDNKDPSNALATPELLMDAHFLGTSVHVSKRENGTDRALLSLENLEVFDWCSADDRFAKIVSIKDGGNGGLADNLSSGVSAFSDVERASHATPPAWSGAAERMEFNYHKRLATERQQRLRGGRTSDRRRHSTSGWPSMIGRNYDMIGNVGLMENDDVLPMPESLLPMYSDYEGVPRGVGEIDEGTSYPEGLSEDGSSAAHRAFRGRHVGLDTNSEIWGVRSSRGRSRATRSRTRASAVFSLEVDSHCPETGADVALRVRLRPLELIYSPSCVDRVSTAFRIPDSVYTYREAQLASINDFANVHSRHKAKMEYAYQNHFSVSMDVDMQAPLLILPQQVPASTPEEDIKLVLVDFGRMTIRDKALSPVKREARTPSDTRPTDKSSKLGKRPMPPNRTSSDLSSRARTNLENHIGESKTGGDMSRFFDEYKISCSNVQVLATSMGVNWRSSTEQRRLHMHVIDRFTFNMVLCVSILQYDRTLPQYKVFANLPSLHIRMSPEKFEVMAQVANSLQAVSDSGSASKTVDAPTKSSSNFRPLDVNELVIGGVGDALVAHAGEASPRMASYSEFLSPVHQSSSPAFVGVLGQDNAVLSSNGVSDARMPTLFLNSSAESVSSSIGGNSALRQDRFLRLPSSSSTSTKGKSFSSAMAGQSTSNNAAGGSTTPRGGSKRSQSFFEAATSSGASAATSPLKHSSRRLDTSDWESASIAASLHETLRTDHDAFALSVDENGGVDDIDDFDNDFYTTVGSVAHTSFHRQTSESGSVSSFVSALQGDELGVDASPQADSSSSMEEAPNKRINISYLQCSMNVAFVMISVTRPKSTSANGAHTTQTTAHNAARARRRSFGMDNAHDVQIKAKNSVLHSSEQKKGKLSSSANDANSSQDGSEAAQLVMSPRQKPIVKPYIREWLDEIEQLERMEGATSLYPFNRKTPTKSLDAAVKQSTNGDASTKAPTSKLKQFPSSSVIDEALDEVLASEGDDDDEGTAAIHDPEDDEERGIVPSVVNDQDDATKMELYEEQEGIILILLENISTQATLRTMETSVDFSMRCVTIHDVMGHDLSEFRLGPGMANHLAQFPQLVRRAVAQTVIQQQQAQAQQAPTHLHQRLRNNSQRGGRIERPRLHSEIEADGSVFSVGLQALAKDSPLYCGVGADLRVVMGSVDVTFSQPVLSALLDSFGRVAMYAGSNTQNCNSGQPVDAGIESQRDRNSITSNPRLSTQHLPLSSSTSEEPGVLPTRLNRNDANIPRDGIQAQVQATLKQLTVSFVGSINKHRSLRRSRLARNLSTEGPNPSGTTSVRENIDVDQYGLPLPPKPLKQSPLAEIMFSEVELRAATREDGQSSMSARMGNFALRDCLTGIGSTFDHNNRRANFAEKSATFTISEQELSLGDEARPPGVLVVGSQRRENDKRPLFLLQSTFYSDAWRRHRLIVDSPSKATHDSELDLDVASGTDESKHPDVTEIEVDDNSSTDTPSSNQPHLDLDEVLDSYLRESPPGSPRPGTPVADQLPSSRRKLPRKAQSSHGMGKTRCRHRGCRSSENEHHNGFSQHDIAPNEDLEEAAQVPVPALPLRTDVQFQVRSFFCRANVDFVHAMVDYIYEGELLRSLSRNMEYFVIREDQKLESTEKDAESEDGPSGAMDTKLRGSDADSHKKISKRSAGTASKEGELFGLDSLQILLFDCSLEFPSTQQGTPMGIIHVDAVDLHNRFFLGDCGAEEQFELLRDKQGGAHAMHAVEAVSLYMSNLSMQVPETTASGNTVTFKLIEDTGIHAKSVRHIGTAWVCRAVHDQFCQTELVPSELNRIWVWKLTPLDLTSGVQAIKSKVSASRFALRISDIHVATISGILDHLSGLDMQDISVKLANMKSHIDINGSEVVPSGTPRRVPAEVSSQISECTCSTAHSSPAPKVSPLISAKITKDDSLQQTRAAIDTLVLSADFELESASLEILWSSSKSAQTTKRQQGYQRVALPPPPGSGGSFQSRRISNRRIINAAQASVESLAHLQLGPFLASYEQTKGGSRSGTLEITRLFLLDERPKHLRDAAESMVDAGATIYDPQGSPFLHADWSSIRRNPKRKQERGSLVHFVTDESIKLQIANTQLCLVEALVLALTKWMNEAQDHASMQGLWPPRLPDLSTSNPDEGRETNLATTQASQGRGGSSTVTDKASLPFGLERSKSLISRNSAGPGSVISRPSLARSGNSRGDGPNTTGMAVATVPASSISGRSPMPPSRIFTGLDSASVAPVYSWASDSGDETSEQGIASPNIRRPKTRSQLTVRSIVHETVTNIEVDVIGLEVHIMERPKQKDSRALTAAFNFTLTTNLSSRLEQRDLITRSSFTIPRKTITVSKRPEWMLDMTACSVRLGMRAGEFRPGSASSHGSRASTNSAQQTSILVQPFQSSIRYRVGQREGSERLVHLLDAGVGQIDSQITYLEIRSVGDIAQRVLRFSSQLESIMEEGASGSGPTQNGTSAQTHTKKANTLGTHYDTDTANQDKSAAARAAVGELTEKTLGASITGAHFTLDFSGARFLLVDDMHGQSSPVIELVARRSNCDIDVGPNGLLARTYFSIGADSYNHRLGAWEPLLEPWRVQIRGLVPAGKRGQRLRMSASVDSQSILNVNFTEAFIEGVSGATQIWNPEKSHVGRGEFQRDSVSLFRIYNETGLPIAFWTRDGEIRPLQSGSEMPIQFESLSIASGRRDGFESEGRRVSVLIRSPDSRVQESPWHPLRDVPLDREGSFLFRLGATSKHPEVRAITITCDVVAVGSAKVMCVRSNLLLRNHCVGPMEVVVPHQGPVSQDQANTDLFTYRLAPGEVIPVPVHVAELINAHIVEVSVRPSAYSDPYDFLPVSLPCDLSPDCSENSSIRTTLDFAAGGYNPDGSTQGHLVTYCAVDCRSGTDAVKALSNSTWDSDGRHGSGSADVSSATSTTINPITWRAAGFHTRGNTVTKSSTSSQKTSVASTAAAAAAAMSGQHFSSRSRDPSRKLPRRRPWNKQQFGDSSSTRQTGTSLRIISFEAPLLVSNLLASPVTYRLRADGASHAAADGQLPVGNSLRWQGVRPEAELSLSIRLSGFDWSSVLQIDGVPFIRCSVHPPSLPAGGVLPKSQSSSSSITLHTPGKTKIEDRQVEEGTTAGVDRQGDGSLQWSAIRDDARVGILREESIQLKDSNRRTLTVSAELSVLPGGLRKLVLYVPYWIVNLSDLHLLVRSASRSASLAETFGGHIAAGQNDAMAVMRRLRMRQKLGERYLNRRGVTGERRAPGGLLDILDDSALHGDKRVGEPLMFSYTDKRRKKGRICVKAADSGWSQAMGLDSAGTAGLIELKQQWNVKSDSPRQLFVLGVSIAVAEGQFRRTKVITLTPRFVLINALGRTLKVKQRPLSHGAYSGSAIDMFGLGGVVGRLFGAKNIDTQRLYGSTSVLTSASERADSIRPGERTPYHWRDASAPREICVRFDEYGWIWSGGFSIDNIGEFYVRLRNEHTHAVYILRVDVSLDRANPNGSSTIFITFRPELPSLPPYRIDNLSLQTLRLYQRGAPPQTQQVLLPYHSCPYTWDDLSLSRMLVVESLAGSASANKSHRVGISGGTIAGKFAGLLGGIWSMLWDQSGVGGNSSESRPVTLGHIELDRLQLATPSTELPHITIGVHADGPTRVLSIVDARNKAPTDSSSPFQVLDGSAAGALDENWWTMFPSNSCERIGVDDVKLEDLFKDGVNESSNSIVHPSAEKITRFELSPMSPDLDLETHHDETSSLGIDMGYADAVISSSHEPFAPPRLRRDTSDTLDVLYNRRRSHDFGANDTIEEEESFEESNSPSLRREYEQRSQQLDRSVRDTKRDGQPVHVSSQEKLQGQQPQPQHEQLHFVGTQPPQIQLTKGKQNYTGDYSASQVSRVGGAKVARQPLEEAKENILASWMELKLSLRGVGISVVESVPRRELLYITVLEIRSRIESVADLSRLQLRVGWIQTDNQLYGAFYPVMFAPRSWNRTAMRFDQLGDDSSEGWVTRSRTVSSLPMVTQDASADPAHLYTQQPHDRGSRNPSPSLTNGTTSDDSDLDLPTQISSGRTNDDDERKPFAEFTLVRSSKFPSLDFVRQVSVRILPMNLKLEPDVLTALLAFSTRCSSTLQNASRWQGDSAEPLAASFMGNSIGSGSQETGKGFARGSVIATRDVVLSGGRQVASSLSLIEPEHQSSSNGVRSVSSRARGGAASRTDAIPWTNQSSSTSTSTGEVEERRLINDDAVQPRWRSGDGQTYNTKVRDGSIISTGTPPDGSLRLPRDVLSGTSTGPVEQVDISERSPAAGGPESLPASQRKLYIEELQIHPVKMHVSFSFRSSMSRMHGMQDGTFNAAGQYQAGSTDAGSVNPLRFALNAMGASLANVDNAPLRLNALVLQNSLSTPDTILGRIFAHYRSQALRQAYLILGSVDLLGDPRGLVQNLGAGVLDFFYEPALGLVRSPKDFGAGLAKGTMSLLRRTILGAATSATGFANGVSALFETLSNDRYTGFKPRSFQEGFIQGMAGLVVAPVNGFREEGLTGLGQGLFFGFTGVFVKPLAGLLKLVKHVSVAIQSTIDPTVKFRRHRIRPPRYFIRLPGDNAPAFDTANKLLVPFDLQKAVGEEVIAMVDGGVYLDEGHLAHVVLEQPLLADSVRMDRGDLLSSTTNTSAIGASGDSGVVTVAAELRLKWHASLIDVRRSDTISGAVLGPAAVLVGQHAGTYETIGGGFATSDEDAEVRAVEAAWRASKTFSFFTFHSKRPFPTLPLWKRMFLIATHQHLLYVEHSFDLERSTWVVPLRSVMDIDIRFVEHSIEDEEGDESLKTSSTETTPGVALRYWLVEIVTPRDTMMIYCWTENQAKAAVFFIRNII